MKVRHPIAMGLTAGACLMIGTVAVAQTAPASRATHPREASSGQAAGRQDQYGHASGVAAQSTQSESTQRKSGSIIVLDREGAAAQRKDGSIVHADFPRSADRKSGENPLYEGNGGPGVNPMDEGKGEANVKPGTESSDNSRSSAHATEALQKKHIAGVKYEDRTVSTPQGAPNGQPSAKGIQEKGLNSAGDLPPNAMAIKENGISASKPKPKP